MGKKFQKTYGVHHTLVLISVLPMAGSRIPGRYLPGNSTFIPKLKPGSRSAAGSSTKTPATAPPGFLSTKEVTQ
ncbi:hypothetical protein GCM10022377_20900 [Zhihengliuella alba]|uniref:Uncharacterized protein n=1 Tax=Zhihengliuella alba TaxID=547018 RepID=A0ABP7DKL4_9MICC